MGWMSWQVFRCETDCKKEPNACINEDLCAPQFMTQFTTRMTRAQFMRTTCAQFTARARNSPTLRAIL